MVSPGRILATSKSGSKSKTYQLLGVIIGHLDFRGPGHAGVIDVDDVEEVVDVVEDEFVFVVSVVDRVAEVMKDVTAVVGEASVFAPLSLFFPESLVFARFNDFFSIRINFQFGEYFRRV